MQRARVVRAGRGPPDRRCDSGAGIPAPVDAAAAIPRPHQSRAFTAKSGERDRGRTILDIRTLFRQGLCSYQGEKQIVILGIMFALNSIQAIM